MALVGVFGLRSPGRFALIISLGVPSFASYRDAVVRQVLQRVFQWAVCWTWSGLRVLQTHLLKSWRSKAPATRITAPSLGPPSRDGLAWTSSRKASSSSFVPKAPSWRTGAVGMSSARARPYVSRKESNVPGYLMDAKTRKV